MKNNMTRPAIQNTNPPAQINIEGNHASTINQVAQPTTNAQHMNSQSVNMQPADAQPQSSQPLLGHTQQITTSNQQGIERNEVGVQQDTARQKDALPFPRQAFLQHYSSINLPELVNSWGNFKRWLSANPSAIPPSNRAKLLEMQNQHWQVWLQNKQQRDIGKQNQQSTTASQSIPQPAQQQLNSQALAQQMRTCITEGLVKSTNNNIPQIAVITSQEIEAFRSNWATKNPNAINKPNDSNIGNHLLSQRKERLQKQYPLVVQYIMNAQQRLRQQMQLNESQGGALRSQHQGGQPGNTGHLNQTQVVQVPVNVLQAGDRMNMQIPQQLALPAQVANDQAEMMAASSVNNLSVPQQLPPQNQFLQLPTTPGSHFQQAFPRPTPQQLTIMTPEQRALTEAQLRARAQLHRPQMTAHTPTTAEAPRPQIMPLNLSNPERELRFKMIVQEMHNDQQHRPFLPLSPEVRQQMSIRLSGYLQSSSELERAIKPFFLVYGKEDLLRQLVNSVSSLSALKSQCQMLMVGQARTLKQQRLDTKEFSILPNEMDDHIMKIRKTYETYQMLMKTSMQGQLQQRQQQQRQQQQQHQPQPQQVLQGQPHVTPKESMVATSVHVDSAVPSVELSPLASSNKSSIRRPSSQRRPSAKAPPAPTSGQPPFSFHTPPPHGMPLYAPSDIPMTLNLPANKKRKAPLMQPQQVEAPVVTKDQSSQSAPQRSQLPKPAVQSIPSAPSWPLKCPIPDCVHAVVGFQTEEELSLHKTGAHEYNDNPLAFCLAQMRKALALDGQGNPMEISKGGDMKDIKPSLLHKFEVTTPSAIIMSRGTTQQSDFKASAPAIGSVQTPQARSQNVLHNIKAERSPVAVAKDPWAASQVAPGTILAAFANLDPLPFAGLSDVADKSIARPSPPVSTPSNTPDSGKDSRPSEQSLSFDLRSWNPFPQYGSRTQAPTGQATRTTDLKVAGAMKKEAEQAQTKELENGDKKRMKMTPPQATPQSEQPPFPMLGPISGLDPATAEEDLSNAFMPYWDTFDVEDDHPWVDFGT